MKVYPKSSNVCKAIIFVETSLRRYSFAFQDEVKKKNQLLIQAKLFLCQLYVCHIVFDELLKESGHGSLIVVSKHCFLIE